jgi:DNA-directed RNA polymerase I subunit RPA2
MAPTEPKERVETCPSFRSGHLTTPEDLQRLRTLTAPHVDSFDYFWEQGLARGVQDIEPAEFNIVDPQKLRDNPVQIDWNETSSVEFWVEHAQIAKPAKAPGERSQKLLPRECRERKLVYAGEISATFCYRMIQRRNGVDFPSRPVRLNKTFGDMPIMVMSKGCHLEGTTPKQLVKLKEEDNEFGGYFIVGGIERCVRLLQVPRRNHATAIQRSSYKNRGNTYTDLGVAMRCARHNGDMSAITNTVHYLTTGGANLKFVAKKQEFLIPAILILRALSGSESQTVAADVAAGGTGMGITDEELYERIVQGDQSNTFLVARAGLLLQDARARFGSLNTPDECLAFIGTRFRRLSQKAETTSDVEIGHHIIRRFVLIHLPTYRDKLECLLLMLRKLYAFAAGDCGVDNADSLQNQEILLPGHLMCTFIKEKFEEFLSSLRLALLNDLRKDFARTSAKLTDAKYWGKMVDRHAGKASGGIGKKVQHFLSTGNIVSTSGLDLMQVSGYTIVAERLNFLRYCAHFRSVHRGQFFMEMKTTAVRKLLPDQWGFLCPVHTPDGGPCGLLSHLALKSKVMAYPSRLDAKGMIDLDDLLLSLGVTPCGAGSRNGDGRIGSTHLHLPVSIDGRIVGGASPSVLKIIAAHLRKLKVDNPPVVPPTLEVGLVPPGNPGAPYPGLYLFTCAARLVRPVLNRASGHTEFIGPLEQGYMDIACLDEDIREGITTHQELDPTNMLSLIANLTPFSDQNQSPRNMYQCQMGKQTMGTPAHSLPYRPDNKLYRLQTPQAPMVQTSIHGEYKMDEYPNGTNAVVAVLSYTGFDMEDSVILNKSSVERGFAHASVYKTIDVSLQEEAKMTGASSSGEDVRMKFSNKVKFDKVMYPSLQDDGLPQVGDCMTEGDPLYCVVDSISGMDRAAKHKEREIAYVQSVRALGNDSGKGADNKVSITLRFPRNPVLGDKFSSRHGQKGVLSILWPQEDMPFSESGISPDVIINPHAFPSRMTIGMMVESMAGKSGALHGNFQNATPFSFHESGDKVSVDYFGEQLQAAGYNYYGSEPLYSGVSGCVMQADLYIGVVYYQRLRHMVLDKYQVRATGPTNELTRQPIKGRKKGGGIRLGEMERDSLLSHGTAFLLQDRLLNCSDKHVAYACCRCGDLLMSATERSTVQTTGQSANEAINKPKIRLYCRSAGCVKATNRMDGNDEAVEPIVLPYVYRYLVNELAAMNVKMRLAIK